jgi:hypothetical protein
LKATDLLASVSTDKIILMLRIVVMLFLVVTVVSCKRRNTENIQPEPLAGTWQLVEVNDKSTGTLLTYPTGTVERIEITLLNDGSFSGKTRVNLFSGGSYRKPETGKILFESLGMMTKVAEDELGSAFLTVLQSCYLQSVMPCQPSSYRIVSNFLTIKTALRYDVLLRKL